MIQITPEGLPLMTRRQNEIRQTLEQRTPVVTATQEQPTMVETPNSTSPPPRMTTQEFTHALAVNAVIDSNRELEDPEWQLLMDNCDTLPRDEFKQLHATYTMYLNHCKDPLVAIKLMADQCYQHELVRLSVFTQHIPSMTSAMQEKIKGILQRAYAEKATEEASNMQQAALSSQM